MKFKMSRLKMLILCVLIYGPIYLCINFAFTSTYWNWILPWSNNSNKSNTVNEFYMKIAGIVNKVPDFNLRYKDCDLGKQNMLNVHIILHTQNDPGWLRTFEQYYINDVQYILDNVIRELQNNPERRFILVEVAFLSMWWKEQSTETKTNVKQLVHQGRLEFVGGWTMNDEATTHYSAIIDQHTLGFDFLKENFGEYGVPKIAWQSDTFGHSREQASIFAQFGFDGLFFARIDYQDYDKRKKSKTLEAMWFGSDSLVERSSIFTGVLYEMNYSSPTGFCFECDVGMNIVDRTDFVSYNVDKKTRHFINMVNAQAKHYSTNHIMWIIGGDFQFKNARINFKNTDKLIKSIRKMAAEDNEDKFNINAFYSTPSCYLYALNKADKTYTSKSDDFFPYADKPGRFWTGYYTSRSSLKRSERLLNNVLQICKQLNVFGRRNIQGNVKDMIQDIKEAAALMQHHHAVSGTSKERVANDFKRIMSQAMYTSHDVLNMTLSSLIVPNEYNGTFVDIQFCDVANISNCPFTESKNLFGVVVYNPFGQNISTYVKFTVSSTDFQILGPTLEPVVSQILPLSDVTKRIFRLSDSRSNSHELYFRADLPAMGYSTYFAINGDTNKTSWTNDLSHSIENEYLRLEFNYETGLLSSITNLKSNIRINAKQTMLEYESYWNEKTSGVFIFRPEYDSKRICSGKPKTILVKGDLVTEVRQIFSNWSSQVIRLYKDAQHFEIEWTVGPLPLGKEVISSFDTSLESNKTFYTDANGRQMMKRVRDHRPTWDFQHDSSYTENYYPVSSRIFIQDIENDKQLTILTDRSQGGSSVRDGQIELMLHRSTHFDDGVGLQQNLHEIDQRLTIITRGTHYIFLDTINSSVRLHRTMAQRLYMSPYFGFVKLNQSPQEYAKQFVLEWSGLKSQLPKNVHILTLEEWHNGTVLLRLEHYFEKDEDPELSKPAIVSLKDLFLPLKIVAAEEQTLGANVRLDQAKRLQWNVEGYGKTPKDMDKFVTPFDQKTMKIELKPMQIRTFILTLE